MSAIGLLSSFTKLTIGIPVRQSIRTITSYKPLLLKVTPCLMGEPLKKKRKMDPQLIKQKEERKKRRIEKQIRKLEKSARQLKPIDELEVPFNLIDEKVKRTRPVQEISYETNEYRALLQKDWTRYMSNQYMADIKEIDRISSSQRKALEALREESEELYNAAIEIDNALIPFKGTGTVATPPIKNYISPDGEYIDISKKWRS